MVNRLRGVLNVAAVKAPGLGDRRKAMLEDMAVLTGGQMINQGHHLLLMGMVGCRAQPQGGSTWRPRRNRSDTHGPGPPGTASAAVCGQ